ncbi:MAG: phage tail fiber protein, partial [Alphaproteobacteria bacterium]|nr:phage tail fiber protein [Alphaproteobacteria bacterium]
MADEHITLNSRPPRIQFIGDGVSTTFPVPFRVFKPEYVEVYLESVKAPSGFEVQVADDYHGTVRFDKAPVSGALITIVRVAKIERTTHFNEGTPMRYDALNYEFDYQMACLQQVADNLNRSMVLPPYAMDPDIHFILPEPVPGRAIVWDSAGRRLENSFMNINLAGQQLDTAVSTATNQAMIATSSAEMAAAKAQLLSHLAGPETPIGSHKVFSRELVGQEAFGWAISGSQVSGDNASVWLPMLQT